MHAGRGQSVETPLHLRCDTHQHFPTANEHHHLDPVFPNSLTKNRREKEKKKKYPKQKRCADQQHALHAVRTTPPPLPPSFHMSSPTSVQYLLTSFPASPIWGRPELISKTKNPGSDAACIFHRLWTLCQWRNGVFVLRRCGLVVIREGRGKGRSIRPRLSRDQLPGWVGGGGILGCEKEGKKERLLVGEERMIGGCVSRIDK